MFVAKTIRDVESCLSGGENTMDGAGSRNKCLLTTADTVSRTTLSTTRSQPSSKIFTQCIENTPTVSKVLLVIGSKQEENRVVGLDRQDSMSPALHCIEANSVSVSPDTFQHRKLISSSLEKEKEKNLDQFSHFFCVTCLTQ